MRASFTAQADGTYTGNICIVCEPQRVKFASGSYRGKALLAHLWSAFLGHFLPEPRASVDRNEEREESSTGAYASAAAGGAGEHTGAGA